MNDWFEWNGTRCTAYGVHVLTQPDLIRPAERVTTEKMFGRSGTLTVLEGENVYDEFIATAECIVADASGIPAISHWLSGAGHVTFATRTGGYYEARVNNQIDFAKILRGNPHRSFVVNFRCQPYFYHAGVADITVAASGASLSNPGTAEAAPIITVNGTGDITLMIGQYIVYLEGLDKPITLNSIAEEAYNGTENMNEHMAGEFPLLTPGVNPISWSGSITSLVIQPGWRDLG